MLTIVGMGRLTLNWLALVELFKFVQITFVPNRDANRYLVVVTHWIGSFFSSFVKYSLTSSEKEPTFFNELNFKIS